MRLSPLCGFLAGLPILLALPATAQVPADQQALVNQYTQSMQAKDYATAVGAAQQIVALNPASEDLRLLADAQTYAGQFTDALATYDRAIAQAAKEKPPESQSPAIWKATLAKIWSGKGNLLLKLHRTADAVAAYQRFAEFSVNPGLAYFNICAVFYNTGDTQNALPACRLSLQADPTRSDAWFVLASVLYVNGTVDANGKFVVTVETRQALEKYLDLAPNGPHAADVKEMLDALAK